jgi:hypothetical protein
MKIVLQDRATKKQQANHIRDTKNQLCLGESPEIKWGSIDTIYEKIV